MDIAQLGSVAVALVNFDQKDIVQLDIAAVAALLMDSVLARVDQRDTGQEETVAAAVPLLHIVLVGTGLQDIAVALVGIVQ